MTLEEIAKIAGVSPATVSRVVNNNPRVSQETRDHVLSVIQEHGYTPNEAARALASSRSHIISLAIPTGMETLFSGYAKMAEGIAHICAKHGYHLMISPLPMDDLDTCMAMLNNSPAEAVVVANAQCGPEFLFRLEKEGIPFIMRGSNPPSPDMVAVGPDYVSGGYMVARYLIGHGRRNLAVIGGPDFHGGANDRMEGFRQACIISGIELPDERIYRGAFLPETGMEAIHAWASKGIDFDGLFCMSDGIAVGALEALQGHGINVPEDISVIGFDDSEIATMIRPRLTTVGHAQQEIGERIANLLIGWLETGVKPAGWAFPVHLVERESC